MRIERILLETKRRLISSLGRAIDARSITETTAPLRALGGVDPDAARA
jgi:hypothetical protein